MGGGSGRHCRRVLGEGSLASPRARLSSKATVSVRLLIEISPRKTGKGRASRGEATGDGLRKQLRGSKPLGLGFRHLPGRGVSRLIECGTVWVVHAQFGLRRQKQKASVRARAEPLSGNGKRGLTATAGYSGAVLLRKVKRTLGPRGKRFINGVLVAPRSRGIAVERDRRRQIGARSIRLMTGSPGGGSAEPPSRAAPVHERCPPSIARPGFAQQAIAEWVCDRVVRDAIKNGAAQALRSTRENT